MMKRTCYFLAALTLVAACAACAACTKDETKKSAEEAASAVEDPTPLTEIPGPEGNRGVKLDQTLLQYVPADSPFVVASLSPIPDALLAYMEKGVTPLVGIAQTAITAAKLQEDDPAARALLDELDGNLSRKGMESLGISIRPRMVFYAIGWSLALRVELADGKRFSAMLDRIEAKAGKVLPKAVLGDITYREVVEDDGAAVIAVIDNYLVLGFMHVNARAKVLPVLLGTQKPAKTMAQAGTMQALVDKYKLMDMGLTYVDSQALARMLTGQATGLSKEIMDASKVDLPELSAVCKKEFTDMAGAAPRLVFGYQAVSKDGYDSLMSLELRPDLAKQLAGLQIASLDMNRLTSGKPMMAMGVAMDLDKAVSWLRDTSARMTGQPYKCEYLQEFNEGLEEMAQGLKTPLPPVIKGAHGFGMMVKDVQMRGLMPTGKGFAVLGVAEPMALINMAKGEVPPLANVTIEKGKPVDVPIGLPGLDKATLLVQGRWLGVAVGDSMTESMTSFLKSGSKAKSPFMVFAYDYKAIMTMTQQMNPSSDPMETQMIEMMTNLMGYSTMSMHFTRDGVLGLMKNRVQ